MKSQKQNRTTPLASSPLGLVLAPILLGLLGVSSMAQGLAEISAGEVSRGRRQSDDTFRAKSGWYVAGMLHWASISDEDFDGGTAVAGGGSTEFLPTVDSALGQGFALGYRNRNHSLEFSYTRVDHDGDFSGFPLDTESSTFNLDYRVHFRVNERLQPHALIGIGLGRLTVEDGSIGDSGLVEDAVFSGGGLNFGGGASYFVTPRLSLGVDLGYRYQTYTSVDGVVDGDLGSNVSGSGPFAAFRLAFTL